MTNTPSVAIHPPRGGLILGLLVAILAPASVSAQQSSMVLVSNVGQTRTGEQSLNSLDATVTVTNSFTTGADFYGYTLTSVEIRFGGVPSPTARCGVSIREDNDGQPGREASAISRHRRP